MGVKPYLVYLKQDSKLINSWNLCIHYCSCIVSFSSLESNVCLCFVKSLHLFQLPSLQLLFLPLHLFIKPLFMGSDMRHTLIYFSFHAMGILDLEMEMPYKFEKVIPKNLSTLGMQNKKIYITCMALYWVNLEVHDNLLTLKILFYFTCLIVNVKETL